MSDDTKPIEPEVLEPTQEELYKRGEFFRKTSIRNFQVVQTVIPKRQYVKDERKAEKVRALASNGLSKTATAIACRMTVLDLNKHYLDDYNAGRAEQQEVVASNLMSLARAQNPQVLIYLGKTVLGWNEQAALENVAETTAVVSSKPMTKEEFAAKYLAQSKEEDALD